MRRILSYILVAFVIFTLVPNEIFASGKQNQEYVQSNIEHTGFAYDPGGDPRGGFKLSYPEYEFEAPSEKWVEETGGLPANEFQDVSVEFQDDILVVDSTVTDRIADLGQVLARSDIQKTPVNRIIERGGFIDAETLDEAAEEEGLEIKPGTIVLDKESMVAFKVDSGTVFNGTGDEALDKQISGLNDTYQISQPQIHEIVKDFELGGSSPDGETVEMNRANISGFAKMPGGGSLENCMVPEEVLVDAIEAMLGGTGDGTIVASKLDLADRTVDAQLAGSDFKYMGEGPRLVNLKFDDETLFAYDQDGMKFTVIVSGGLAISKINIDGRWSAFSGYKLSINAQEEMYLIIDCEVEIHKEFQIPLIALDIPFGVGRVQAGLYLVVGADGSLALHIEAREFMSFDTGIKGKTAFFVPCSFDPWFDKAVKLDGGVEVAGKIDVHVFFGPLMNISICGVDLIGAGLLLGVGLEMEMDDQMLDINLYAFFNIYIDLFGKRIDLVKWKPSLLRKKQRDTGGYLVTVQEAFLNIDRIGGTIKNAKKIPFFPLEGAEYQIFVFPPGQDYTKFNPEKWDVDQAYRAATGMQPLDWNKWKNDKEYKKNTNPNKYVRILGKGPDRKGWFNTTDEGEFFINNTFLEYDFHLMKGDMIVVKFKGSDGKYKYSTPEAVWLPFDTINVRGADAFNDYIIGNVDPVRVNNWEKHQTTVEGRWEADPPEEAYSYKYYANSKLMVQCIKYLDTEKTFSVGAGWYEIRMDYTKVPIGGEVYVYTDEFGNFDTSNPLMKPHGEYDPVYNGRLDVLPAIQVEPWEEKSGGTDYPKEIKLSAPLSKYIAQGGLKISFDTAGATPSQEIFRYPSLDPFAFSRTLERVEGSEEKVIEGRKIVDRIQYRETIFVANSIGKRTLTESDIEQVQNEGFSTQDLGLEVNSYINNRKDSLGNRIESDPDFQTYGHIYQIFNNPVETKPKYSDVSIVPVLDENGDPTGTVAIRRLVTVEWVWQEHPQPLLIIPDSSPVVQAGDSWTLEGKGGFAPYKWTLLEAPPGLEISLKNSKYVNIDVPETMEPGEYDIKVRLEQDLSVFLTDPESGGLSLSFFDKTNIWNSWVKMPYWDRDWTKFLQDHKNLQPRVEKLDPGDDPPPPVEKTFTLTVLEPAAKPPVILDEPHGFRFSKEFEGSYTTTVRAEGTEPITFSVDLPANLAGYITIGEYSGEMTIRENIPPGTYVFVVRAENIAGYDTRDCSLTVDAAAVPPVLLDDDHRFKFDTQQRKDYTFNIRATGTQPITFSVSGLPPGISSVTIDKNTGVLSIPGNTDSGSFEFYINAQNKAGTDSRKCSLYVMGWIGGPYGIEEISALTRPAAVKPVPYITGAPYTLGSPMPHYNTGFIRLSSETEMDPGNDGEDTGPMDLSIPWDSGYNEMTIRCDDTNDAYSWDRFRLNGADFLKWHTRVYVWTDERFISTYELIDRTELCNKYHRPFEASNYATNEIDRWEPDEGELPEQEISWEPRQIGQAVKSLQVDPSLLQDASVQKEGLEPSTEFKALIQEVSGAFDEIQEAFENAPDDPGIGIMFNMLPVIDYNDPAPRMTRADRAYGFGFLEYGPILDALEADPNGIQIIDLEEINSTVVTGKLFEGLMKYKNAGLKFIQPEAGASVLFMGADIKSADPEVLFDFGYASSGINAETMLAAAAGDENALVYTFMYHGELPGMATFDIDTNHPQGAKVNIYRYDAESDTFTLIDKVTVGEGGVVEYRNNTMSEYIVTTVTIGGAAGAVPWLIILLIALIGVAGGCLAWYLIRKKKGQNAPEQQAA